MNPSSLTRSAVGSDFNVLKVLLLTGAVFAQEDIKLVSVFPFQAVGVSKPDAVTLTGLFETALVNTQVVRVVEQTEAEKILESCILQASPPELMCFLTA